MSSPDADPVAPRPDDASGDAPDVRAEASEGGGLQAVFAVAALAFRESARNRVLYALVGAMLLAAGAAYVVAWVSGGENDLERQLTILADLCLAAISLLGTIAAIFLGTNLIYQEVERRTIYLLLSRPIGRAGLVLGKYLGLAAVIGAAVVAMGLGFLAVFAAAGGAVTGALLLALVMVYLELLVVLAVALFFSVAAHPIEGAVFAFVVALAGHVTGALNELAAQMLRDSEGPPGLLAVALTKLLYVVYVLFPNLSNFDLRAEAVYGLPLEAARFAWPVVYAVLYVTAALAAAVLVFRRRSL